MTTEERDPRPRARYEAADRKSTASPSSSPRPASPATTPAISSAASSRPPSGVAEDPVTGSAHCTLIPYWAGRLDKHRLLARQVSRRGGELFCELLGDRVSIAGRAALFLEGVIRL